MLTPTSPSHESTFAPKNIIKKPISNWAGISQDFRLPKRLEYIESTIGAHNNFKLNGQFTKLNSA